MSPLAGRGPDGWMDEYGIWMGGRAEVRRCSEVEEICGIGSLKLRKTPPPFIK